jgi:hypothetical protein
MSKVIVPEKYVSLYKEVYRRTKDYIKTKEILLKTYGVNIHLEPIN